MAYDLITAYQSANHNARPAGTKPTSITIHHWGLDGQKFQNVVNYLCRKNGSTSAHFVVEAGKVARIVDPSRRAWHAGTNLGNNTSIGVECRPEATDADYATVAELIANLRREYGNLPLKRHSDWKATACPGRWDLARLDALARGVTPSPSPAPAPTPQARNADGSLRLAIDGKRGPGTISRWQEVMGTPIDGRISIPSTLIRADQEYLNRELAAHLGNLIGGRLSIDGREGPKTVRARQFLLYNRHAQALLGRAINLGRDVDGSAGPETTRLHQHALNQATARTGGY